MKEPRKRVRPYGLTAVAMRPMLRPKDFQPVEKAAKPHWNPDEPQVLLPPFKSPKK